MLEIDGVGMGVNWMHFLEATLEKPKPLPPQNTSTQTSSQPPVLPPQITVNVNANTDPSKPTNGDISAATTLIQTLAEQYRPPPPEITVTDPTTKAAQQAIQGAQTQYDNAYGDLQKKYTTLTSLQSDPTASPADVKKAQTEFDNAQTATNKAARELEVTTDAGYMVAYAQQAKEDGKAVPGAKQAAADALKALQQQIPGFDPKTSQLPKNMTPQQLGAYDAWQKADAAYAKAQSRENADIANSNLAYAQLQGYASDKTYAGAMDAGIQNLNDKLAPLGLEVQAPEAIDSATAQGNIASAADDANYANACLSAASDASNVADIQVTYDAVSGKFGPTVMNTTVGAQKDLLTRAQTAAATSGGYLQMLASDRNATKLQTSYNNAVTTSNAWHKAHPDSLLTNAPVDTDVANAYQALTDAKTQASLMHDSFVAAYGNSLAAQYDDAANGLQNKYDHRTMCTVNDPTPLEIKGLKVVASALHAADGRLTDSVNDKATKTALDKALTTQAQNKSTLQTVQQQYDDWNKQHGQTSTPFDNVVAHGSPGHVMLTASGGPYLVNPYSQQLSDARDALDRSNAQVDQLQLLSNSAHAQVLFDQFYSGLSDNLLNPVTDDDKADFAKALDQFYASHRGQLSNSMLNQASEATNKGAAYDFHGMSDNEQKNLIGQALQLKTTPSANKNDLQYSGDALDTIDKVYNEIHDVGGDHAKVSVMPMVYASKDSGMTTTALFKVTSGDGKTEYVDDTGAHYSSVDNFIDDNQLSSDGTLDIATGYENGTLKVRQSSAHHDDWWDSTLHTLGASNLNLGTLLGGIGLEVIGSVLDFTGVGLPLGISLNAIGGGMITGATIAAATYSANDLVNRGMHDQSMSIMDAGARADYINLVPLGASAAAEKVVPKLTATNLFKGGVEAVGLDAGKAANVVNKTARYTAFTTAMGGAGEAAGQLVYDAVTGKGNIARDVSSLVQNVGLVFGKNALTALSKGVVRNYGQFAARNQAGNGNLFIGGQQVGVRGVDGSRTNALTLDRSLATIDGKSVTVDPADGTLRVGNRTLTYEGMPVRVLTGANRVNTGHARQTGLTAVLGDDGSISIVAPGRDGRFSRTRLNAYDTGARVTIDESGGLTLSDGLNLSRPGKVLTPEQIPERVQQIVNRNAPPAAAPQAPADPVDATRDTPVDTTQSDPVVRQATQDASARISQAAADSARMTSEQIANASRGHERRAQTEQESIDTRRAERRAAQARAVDLRRVDDPRGTGADEARPMTFRQRVAWTAANATELPPEALDHPGGLPLGSRETSPAFIDEHQFEGHTLYVVRNDARSQGVPQPAEEAAPLDPASPNRRAATALPDESPIVVLEGSVEAERAPEIANTLNRPVLVAQRGVLAADGAIDAPNGFVRFDPAPRAAALAETAAMTESGLYVVTDEMLTGAQNERVHDEPMVYRNGLYVPKEVAEAKSRSEETQTPATDKTQAARPRVAERADTENPEMAAPDMREEPAATAGDGKVGLLTRLQMRFGGAPLPNEVSALAQQSGTLAQQMRQLEANGWTVKVGREGRGSRIDARKKRVMLDGGLRETGSMTYALAHETKHAVEAIDGTTGLDYSGRRAFTRKALEAEARAQINAFEARYEIEMAGEGNIAANVRLPDAIEKIAGQWKPTDDYAGTVEKLADAFGESPVSGEGGKTYAAFYGEAFDRVQAGRGRRGADPGRVMPAPDGTPRSEGGHDARVPVDPAVLEAGFEQAVARSPVNEATPLSFADDLEQVSAHEFLLDDRYQYERSGYSTHAIGLPFSRPTELTRARAQELADISGLYVFTPRVDAPTVWEQLTPRPRNASLDGRVELDADTQTLHVVGDDGVRRPIDPEAHLGRMLGEGAYKTAFELGNKTVVVYRDLMPLEVDPTETPTPVDEPHAMIAKTDRLKALGAPYVARIDGVARVHGHDALVMDTYAGADRLLTRDMAVTGPGSGQHMPFYDLTLFNERSIESLSATRDWMVDNNVQIIDLQFLVGRDGTFHLADFEEINENRPPRPVSLKTIDDYIALAQSQVERRSGATAPAPGEPVAPAAPVAPVAVAPGHTSGNQAGEGASFAQRVEWTRERARPDSPFAPGTPDVEQLQYDRTSRAWRTPERDATIVQTETAEDGSLLLDGQPISVSEFTLQLGHDFREHGGEIVFTSPYMKPEIAAQFANLWGRPVYVPHESTYAADGSMVDLSHLQRYDPSPLGGPDLGQLAADSRGVYRNGDPTQRLSAEQHMGTLLGYGGEKMVFELGHDAALGIFERGPRFDNAYHLRTAREEFDALAHLRALGVRTVSMSGPFSVHNRVGVLYRPLGIMHTHDMVRNGALPERISRAGLANLKHAEDVATRLKLDYDFQGIVTRDGDFLVNDPGPIGRADRPMSEAERAQLEMRHADTLFKIQEVRGMIRGGMQSGRIELAHPEAQEVYQPGEYGQQRGQKPSIITRIRMRFGGAPLPKQALDMIGHSDLLNAQMRLWKQAGWKVVLGREGQGSKTDVARRRIVIDGKFRQPGAIVYTLAHEAGHATEAIQGKLSLDYSSPEAYARSLLDAEARAQINAFAVRDEIKAATGVDIGAQVRLPEAIEREYGRARADDPQSVARLADAFGAARPSLPGHADYRSLYEAQARTVRVGEAPPAMAAPDPSNAPVPAGGANANAAAGAGNRTSPATPEERAAALLDEHGKRTLRRLDGARVPRLDVLAKEAGRDSHVLITQHTAAPKSKNALHSQPKVIAEVTVDEHGALGKPQPVDRSGLPRDLKRAMSRNSGSRGLSARKGFDFYISPVGAEELANFGGASKIEVENDRTKVSWQTQPSNRGLHPDVVRDADALAQAPHFKRPKQAGEAAATGQRIYAVDDESGKVLGHAKHVSGDKWRYYEKAKVDGTEIAPTDLREAFRRHIGRLGVGPTGRRGVSFFLSDLEPADVTRLGGFDPVKKKDPDEAEQKPHRKISDITQVQIERGSAAARRGLGHVSDAARRSAALLRRQQSATQAVTQATARAAVTAGTSEAASKPLLPPNMLPKGTKATDPLAVMDFGGHNALHLLRALDQKSIGDEYHIYVYDDVKDSLALSLGAPTAIIAPRDGGHRWFDTRKEAENPRDKGVPLDEMPIGRSHYGANMHFVLTRLEPAEFLDHTGPTRLKALEARRKELDAQWREAKEGAKTWSSYSALADHIKSRIDGMKTDISSLRRRVGTAHATETLDIDIYQPAMSTSTVVEAKVRNGAPDPEQWFGEQERIAAYNGRKTGEGRLRFSGRAQTVMADFLEWKGLGNSGYVARDVTSTSPRFAPIPRKTLLRIDGERIARHFGIATTADRRAIGAFVDSPWQVQRRVALMSRSFSLRDDPALMTQQVERFGGVTPVVTLVVDPHSLAAALGQPHDPDFLRDVKALGEQEHATFNADEGIIEPAQDSNGKPLYIDELHHLHKWLTEASKTGFAIRLETAPSRALVSDEDMRFQAGTDDTYMNHVRTLSALDRWAQQHPDTPAPSVMVTFHGWDSVLESVPGAGHARLLREMLDRPTLEWLHVGLSYGTHGADFIANQDLTTALADLIVEYRGQPEKLARLHGADALTRVFERVDRQTLADQQALLFAEVERIGRNKGLKPEDLDALREQLYQGNTTEFLNAARKRTIDYARTQWTDDNPARGRVQERARSFSIRWHDQYGNAVVGRRFSTPSALSGTVEDPFGYWSSAVSKPELRNNDSKPISLSRKTAAQLETKPIDAKDRAKAELTALRVHEPLRHWWSPKILGWTVAGGTTSGFLGANAVNLLHTFGSEGLHRTSTSLFVGTRAGRVFQALHQGAVTSLKNGDPRVFDSVVDRIERSLRVQLGPQSINEARLAQLDLIAKEGKAKAAQFRKMNEDGLLSFDDAVSHTKAIAVETLLQMQGVMGGTSLKRLHRGSPRHWIGVVGRSGAMIGYSVTAATNVATAWSHPAAAPILTTLGATLGFAYTSRVFYGGLRHINAEKRSMFVRFTSSAGDFVTSAAGFANGINQLGMDNPMGWLSISSAAILGAAQLHARFPNATPGVSRFPTALALAPVGIYAATLLNNIFGDSGGSSANQNNTQHMQPPGATGSPSPQPTSPSSQPGTPGAPPTPGTSATPTTPGAPPTNQPGQPPSQQPTQPTQPPAKPKPYLVVDGDSLWVIADRHRQTLLDAAHVPQDKRAHMSRGRQDQVAFEEILQLNPGLARHPGHINPGDQIVVG
ncbi:LWXIA domain-containing protein [Trinickia caryophylli]|uniref:LysM domain-containing protein n=1 Tax=Trinickia caryophylli TaxID=28094 RepID=A0A1X7FK43_TRICW|nr:LWXIA domain-containing protein [Trinickia caryophylli]TRX19307.1 LWXIA domain-containing protein [Trinickia caryophylli]WQE13391.1 LWXIA domain-containing protein [Trinickia caryophylli]GLU34090.1 hypothetical protein Busp01_39320 [Trinickia caryophylli]SMF53561.1 LysM domain-containing protein [Trinickia caryophylli]